MDECAYEELGMEYGGVKCCLSEMVRSSFLSSFNSRHVFSLYKIAKEMERISERLNKIAEEREKFHLTETTPERRNAVTDQRQTNPLPHKPVQISTSANYLACHPRVVQNKQISFTLKRVLKFFFVAVPDPNPHKYAQMLLP